MAETSAGLDVGAAPSGAQAALLDPSLIRPASPSKIVWASLGGLFLAHLLLDFFLLPFDLSGSGFKLAVQLILLAIAASQPTLVATWAVLWPASRPIRYAVSLTLLFLIAVSMLAGRFHQGIRWPKDMALLVVVQLGCFFLVAAFLLWAVSKWRGWQVTSPWTRGQRHAHSLRQLFFLTAVVAVLAALGRLLFGWVEWAEGSFVGGEWGQAAISIAQPVVMMAIGYLLALPAVALFLCDAPRRRRALWTALGFVAAVLGNTCWLQLVNPGALTSSTAGQILSVAAGAYGSFYLTLAVLRSTGLRITRVATK